MANAIAKFKKYVDLLDEVYKIASVSSVLDGDGSLTKSGANANELIVPKLSMDGLADYTRNSGYVKGDVTLTNETVAFNYDRGRKFHVDAMDNEETVGLAFGKLSSEFLRTKVGPETDAFRFAVYAGVSGISKVSAPAVLTTGEAVLAALLVASNKMDEDEVPGDQRYLFITPTLINLALNVDTNKSKAVLDLFAGTIKVPQTRFYTAITLQDGTTAGETGGGFIKDATNGKNINFEIIHKPAVLQYPKHIVNKVFSPDDNQDGDDWIFNYRSYGLADAYENKVAGIYLHYQG